MRQVFTSNMSTLYDALQRFELYSSLINIHEKETVPNEPCFLAGLTFVVITSITNVKHNSQNQRTFIEEIDLSQQNKIKTPL